MKYGISSVGALPSVWNGLVLMGSVIDLNVGEEAKGAAMKGLLCTKGFDVSSTAFCTQNMTTPKDIFIRHSTQSRITT